MPDDLALYLRIEGPFTSAGHLGPVRSYRLLLVNIKGDSIDLTPWPEKKSFSRERAVELATRFREVTGLAIRAFEAAERIVIDWKEVPV